jgi:putative membrane protein
MKRLNLIIVLAAVMFGALSCTDDDDKAPDGISEIDRNFILNAADGGIFKVEAGRLAAAKGDTSREMINSEPVSVRSHGQMMVTDHTKANEELMALAMKKQVGIPTTLGVAKQQKLDSLNNSSGTAFNSMYKKMMVAAHQEAISLFETVASNGDDNEIKSWAGGRIPALKQHLDMSVIMRDSNK